MLLYCEVEMSQYAGGLNFNVSPIIQDGIEGIKGEIPSECVSPSTRHSLDTQDLLEILFRLSLHYLSVGYMCIFVLKIVSFLDIN